VNLDTVVPQELKNSDLNKEFYSKLAVSIAEEVLKCGGSVPVITGYFGVVPGSLLSAIGRGYTDLCAALVAVGLGAEELQIWKEVDGIFTADPRKVPTARLLSSITPEEAAELTFFGSEVFPLQYEKLITGGTSICL
jgi:aspartate kinase